MENQHDGGAEPDSDTDVWEDDHGEDPAEEDDRDSVVSGEQSVGGCAFSGGTKVFSGYKTPK